ncbi:hypothetical protein NDU88_001818 [Pleurodeles waltl]|uniref:Uncharacterized protein n=1 Tax=Pleurodeles waltl TaxID=8319 RepID=A0AAV7NDL3_PLEWA|nr:hypothetical protein NDU88_001818 [Pleurodeles waltl]
MGRYSWSLRSRPTRLFHLRHGPQRSALFELLFDLVIEPGVETAERKVKFALPRVARPFPVPPRVRVAGLLVRAVDGSLVNLVGRVRDIMDSRRVVVSPSAMFASFSPTRDIVSLPGLGMVLKGRPFAPGS